MEYAPFVRIDWAEKTVEIDVEVVLRSGPLELLACSPQTREHESIFRVPARPLRIFEAMGLIGLEPGAPARYDESKEEWLPAFGTPLDIRIQWTSDGKRREVPPHEWLFDVKQKRPAEPVRWVFAGSRTARGRFGADMEGTVVTVVDFTSALIALDASHSADNEALWLHARTEAIPPVGTKCVLVIRAAAGRRIVVGVRPDGRLILGDAGQTPKQVAEALAEASSEDRPAVVRVEPLAGAKPAVVMQAVDHLVAAGLPRSRVMPYRPPVEEAPAKSPVAGSADPPDSPEPAPKP